jgi:azurin
MKMFNLLRMSAVLWAALSVLKISAAEQNWVVYDPPGGKPPLKNIVLISGDEEYRSEEALPMLGKILSQRHGFKCTVLFSVNADGTINPNNQESVTNPTALDSADLIIMQLRYRKWPAADMQHFIDAYKRGVPIIGLRTSTHAFNYPGGHPLASYNKFGKRVLGEEWVNHWGNHKKEATRGIIEESAKDDPILRGVHDLFGDTDVYEAYPAEDAKILVRGQVLKGMQPTAEPASYKKKRATDKQEQDINTPMMPVAWTRDYKNEAGKVNKVFCTTMGSATDLQNEGLRRLVVNAVYWGLGLEVPQQADVRFVGDFKPTMYGFDGFKRGMHPSDFALGAAPQAERGVSPLQLNPGDHIAILGNALPDRMQHFGYFETLIQGYYPQHNLVVRNLSAAGDEVSTWHRSENFGTRDQWLERVKADVILAFYGFNESTKGPGGLDKFKNDLDTFLKETKEKNYSGKGSPRVVLVSPVADERNRDSNYPDPAKNNANIALYTSAMRDVAAANNVQFIDLYGASLNLYSEAAKEGKSLTVNSHYLTQEGDRRLASILFEAVFGNKPLERDLEKLRQVVNDKNEQWHHRYRTIDGYNVFGGRSALAYQHDKAPFITDRNAPPPYISNYKIMQEEMSQRDVMTANRDKRVWAVARGGDLAVDDSNLPEVEAVPTNKPGPNADESHVFLSGEEAISKMTVHSGMKVNLFADEKQFPELIKPVQMAWDTKGRLWVAAWRNYPERAPTSKIGDSLLIFEDTDGDGKADKVTHFIDDLNAPTGFQFYKDGVLVMQAPDLWWVRDTDGDGKADYKERVLMGMDSADSHHTANAICHDPGGAIYLSDGVFHRTQVETYDGPTRNSDAGIYRFEPRTGHFETYVNYGFANPHGRVFDYWGNDLITDATGNNTYFGPAFSGHIDYEKGKHAGMNQFWDRPSRPCPATGILTSRHFPDELQGEFLNLNVISFQGVYMVKVNAEGSGLKGETQENLISSTDPNFRPICISTGPDGAIYFCDWHNPIIGHMQHHLRDPNRDHEHGRIYRITYEGRPLLKAPKIAGAPVPALLALLKEPENQTRELAKVELENHSSSEVLPAVDNWVTTLDKQSPAYEHEMMEALWVYQWQNTVNEPLLRRMLKSPDYRARAAAAHVLCYWRDRVSDSLQLFRTVAEDENPRVRLEAVRAASFYRTPAAADVALAILKRPMDYYLDYTLNETLRQLETYWRKAIQDGLPIAADNPKGLDRLISSLNVSELDKVPRTEGVLSALLTRPGVAEASRLLALDELAKKRNTTRVAELLKLIDTHQESASLGSLARLLTMCNSEETKSERPALAKLATGARAGVLRRSAWAALAIADGGYDTVWADASKNPAQLVDLISAVPMVLDPELRNKAAQRVKPLLTRSAVRDNKEKKAEGRYVRIELPRLGTLSLAEVEVLSDGRNVARNATASQSSTEYDAPASRAIDGRSDGSFSSGTITHTRENTANPWWEVDLGREYPIENVVVWNRSSDGESLANRLEGFTLTVLDGQKQEIFKKANLPAPVPKSSISIGAPDYNRALRVAAIDAYVSMPKEQPAAFGTLSKLIAQDQDVAAAAQALRSLPRANWSKDDAAQTAPELVAWARKVPESGRTSQDYVQTIQVADELAGILAPDKGAAIRHDLKSLRVPVFVVHTVREQMRFDTTRLVVEAGKPFQVIVENVDFMPHNFVIVKPNTREKVGARTETMRPDQIDSQGRAFIPRTSDILAGTRLLESGQSATLSLTAPTQEGLNEFVCTFPGHWQVMFGQLVVTKDVDEYLAKNPQAPTQAASAEHAHNHFE